MNLQDTEIYSIQTQQSSFMAIISEYNTDADATDCTCTMYYMAG